mgnify:CR=1 FL=1
MVETLRGRADYTRIVRPWWLTLIVVAVRLTFALVLQPDASGQTYRAAIDLVVVDVTVKDRDGRLVRGLPR